MTDLTTAVSALETDAVQRFFSDSDAESLVALIDGTSDEDLEAMMAVDHVREAAVTTVLDRLAEFAVPDRLARVSGVVRFDLLRPRAATQSHTLHFRGGTVVAAHPDGRPDVVIELRMLDFVRLVSGGANAALLHLGGRLVVRGDAMLALTVGGVFRVPGREGVAVDPTALDVVEVARTITGVKDAHLREVMAGGFREVVLEEVFRRLPDFVDPEKARKHQITIGFKITGRPDGDADRYVVLLEGGQCRVERSGQQERHATVTAGGAAFLKLVTGNLGPVRAVMKGDIRVSGDPAKALAFSKIVRIPSPKG